MNTVSNSAPGRGFWILTLLSVPLVGGVAYLQYSRVDKARSSGARSVPDDLPVIDAVPEFALVDRDGRGVGLSDLRGKVWVADLIFTRCRTTCPVMTSRMLTLYDDLRKNKLDGVLCVSISVDPEWDTPQRLREYTQSMGIDPARWLFLTGGKKEVRALATTGLRLGMSDPPPGDDQVLHSTRYVLVDRQGRLRGYYSALTDDEELDSSQAASDRELPEPTRTRLLADINRLLDEGDR